MLKALAQQSDGRRVIVIGLSNENLRRLMAGEPIYSDLTDIEVETPILIVGGTTEKAIADSLEAAFELTGGDVTISDDPPDWAKGGS